MYSYSHFNPNLILLFTPTVQFYYWIHSTPSPTFQLQHYSYFLLPLLNPTTGSIPLLLPLFNSNPTPFLYSSVQPYYWIYSTPTPTFQLQHYSYFLLLLLNLTTGSIQLLLPPFNSNPTPTFYSYCSILLLDLFHSYSHFSTPHYPTIYSYCSTLLLDLFHSYSLLSTPTLLLFFTSTVKPYYWIYSTPTPTIQLHALLQLFIPTVQHYYWIHFQPYQVNACKNQIFYFFNHNSFIEELFKRTRMI